MIYLDNSATSYPKPQGVRQAVQRAMVEDGANPGRSSYGMCFRTTQALYGVRQQAEKGDVYRTRKMYNELGGQLYIALWFYCETDY